MSLLLALALQADEAAPELYGAGWVNSKELSLEKLRGKIIVLYFFEKG